MKIRLALLMAGAVAGAISTGAGLWAVREYRRHFTTIDATSAASTGVDAFVTLSGADEGVGPAFSATSCASCHGVPTVGGSGLVTTLRVARRNTDGTIHSYGGGLVVPLFAFASDCQAVIPADANVFSRRLPTTTFGSGLIEAISDAELLALEDPDDRDGDGVSGRAARVHDLESGESRIGRFGWKAQQATLLGFAAQAYFHEMGVTNDHYPADAVLGLSAAQVRECEAHADPEDQRQVDTGLRSIDLLATFMKSLPEPEPAPATTDTEAGREWFATVGCAACHRPQVGTARAYSDFLLHDIGTGDGIPEGDAGPHEMRTAPLWGIRFRHLHLHDGSAGSVAAAIERHSGEADAARRRFTAMSAADQRQLVAFVKSR